MKSKLEYDYGQRLDEYMLELLAEAEAEAAEKWSRSQAWHITSGLTDSNQQRSGLSILQETEEGPVTLFFPIVKPEDIF